jgi:hypothetical protein
MSREATAPYGRIIEGVGYSERRRLEVLERGATMHAIDPEGRGPIRRPFSTPLLPPGLLLLLMLAVLASSHAVFPFFPLLLVALLFAARGSGRAGAWRGDPNAARMPGSASPALPSGGIGKEKEVLRVLESRGEITAARTALETSLGVAEAGKVLSGLANEGHVRVVARGGTLAYALWE